MDLHTTQRRIAFVALTLLAIATVVALGNTPRLITADAAYEPNVPWFYIGVAIAGVLAGLVALALRMTTGARVLLRVAGLLALVMGLFYGLVCLDLATYMPGGRGTVVPSLVAAVCEAGGGLFALVADALGAPGAAQVE